MRILLHLLVFVAVWGVGVAAAALLVPLPWGPLLAAALVAWLFRGYLLRPGPEGWPARRELLRLRRLDRAALRSTLAAVLPFLLFTWALGDVYTRLVPVPEEALNPFGEVLEGTRGRVTVAILAVGIAPLVEELFFRGLIQRPLEARLGATRGILLAAALFALSHFIPWILPVHFAMGVAMGFAAYATRSIWAAVILHAANNVVAMAGALARGEVEADPIPTLWESGPGVEWWVSVATLAGATVLLAWSAQRLWEAGREARLRWA